MPRFVVQEHHAKKLHWDFRLEVDGVLKSWAVPRGPSMNPADKRLAIEVPDHDLAHADYEGIIPGEQYGAGPVLIWDSGTYESLDPVDPSIGIQQGNQAFRLNGRILKGDFRILKMKGPGREKAWLLMKKKDVHAKDSWTTPVQLTDARRQTLAEVAPACSISEE